MGVAQKPRSWPRWVNFTPALVGHFYIGGDTWRRELSETQSLQADAVIDLFEKKERESWVAYPDEPLSSSRVMPSIG